MCIVLFTWQPEATHPLIAAANRDEFHRRPAEPARWRGDILCGLDLEAGGTWLGVTRSGRFAVVTNYREPIVERGRGRRSRGALPMAFLTSDESPERFARRTALAQDDYGAFNLLVGDGRSLWYLSNRGAPLAQVMPGLHGLSNGPLDEPWPKILRGKRLFSSALQKGAHEEDLLRLLQDRQCPADDQLPRTGVALELERLVAPIFIESPTYGTRASTVIKLVAGGEPVFVEQRWHADGTPEG
jgi:uncharacterized protein with NRDE domain